MSSQLLRRRALFLCRQKETSSLRMLSVDRSGRQMIRNFSLRHRLHRLLTLLRRVRRQNAPSDGIVDAVVFECPDMFTEFGRVAVLCV